MIEVWMTFLALLENQRVRTMMSPESTRKMVGVAAFPARLVIMKLSAGVPLAVQAL